MPRTKNVLYIKLNIITQTSMQKNFNWNLRVVNLLLIDNFMGFHSTKTCDITTLRLLIKNINRIT